MRDPGNEVEMASESLKSTVNAVVPLNGKNYPTWKVQCRMALMKEGLWNIVDGTEAAPGPENDRYTKFLARRNRALAIIVLSLEPSLLYLIGDPEDPTTVWEKLANQFQKRTWANKLEMRRNLFSLRLKNGGSVQEHVKAMTEIFEGLSVIGDPISEEDRVVHLLASLPDSYNMLVTAFEANVEVPKFEVVTERLLHEERKLKERADVRGRSERAMTGQQRSKAKGVKCHHCGKFGDIRRNSKEWVRTKPEARRKPETPQASQETRNKLKANRAEVRRRDSGSSDSDCIGLMANHMMSASCSSRMNDWIVDSGATCHMCNDDKLFVELCSLKQPLEVTLGDGCAVEATGQGTVVLEMTSYVPDLSYNLLSVSKAVEAGKVVEFDEISCRILDANRELITAATRVGNLYYLNCLTDHQQANAADKRNQQTKEDIWHRRYGHLGVQNLQKLAKEELVDGFDYNSLRDVNFCEPCLEGKHQRRKFPTDGGKRSGELLGLVHSDVCGKMNAKSLSGAEYFLTFIDDKSRYVWVYILKHKDDVFPCFLEWKALVERSTNQKLKALRTDNGGEYLSTEFQTFLRKEGVRHELTVPKTPEQNGVAERMNRTLVESVRAMLADARLPHRFWAEALSTAVYLRNRSPAMAIKGMTPFEALTGEKPNVEHLRVFGCAAYAHVAKDDRKKLDVKSRKCILLGYGTETKGYRLYDLRHAKVLYSRDVIFNESSRGIEEPNEEEKKNETPYAEFGRFSDQEPDEQPVADELTDPVLSRPERDRRPPDYYGEWAAVTSTGSDEPKTVKEALAGPGKAKWMTAMEKEMESLHTHDVWDLVELPKDRKAVGSKWVYKVKKNADGSVGRYKARLVAQGFTQKFGIDYDETFCPVVRFESVRTVIALAVQYGLKLHQMDVATAFLNGDLKEEVYMKQPEGFETEGQEHLVCRLKRSIYGLKQSSRCWNSVLDKRLK